MTPANREDPTASDPPRLPMVVDAHLHVWDPARADYPWLTPDLAVLDHPYRLAQVQGELVECGVSRVVLVQAADNVADTLNMFDQAAKAAEAATGRPRDAEVAGVVGWLPLASPKEARRLLDSWASQPIVGIRHLVHREADPDWMLRKDVGAGLDLLTERGLTFDVCAESLELLARVPILAERHPGLRLVIDHLAKPPIASGGWEPWAEQLSESAAHPNVTAKISGLNTAAAQNWTHAELQPYVDHALAVFGPQRLMVGGDWPFALLRSRSYSQVWKAVHRTLDHLPETDRQALYGGTATAVYRLGGEATTPC